MLQCLLYSSVSFLVVPFSVSCPSYRSHPVTYIYRSVRIFGAIPGPIPLISSLRLMNPKSWLRPGPYGLL